MQDLHTSSLEVKQKPGLVGDLVAAGKLGVVQAPGKKARLIGDGSVSNAFSFDVAAAHKRITITDAEQGLTCFALEQTWICYRSCYFGAKYSAYWWSRASAWIVRTLHKFLFVRRALFNYVDDGLALLPSSVAPLLATCVTMLLVTLGLLLYKLAEA